MVQFLSQLITQRHYSDDRKQQSINTKEMKKWNENYGKMFCE